MDLNRYELTSCMAMFYHPDGTKTVHQVDTSEIKQGILRFDIDPKATKHVLVVTLELVESKPHGGNGNGRAPL